MMTTYIMTEDIYVNGIIMHVADSYAPLEYVQNATIYLTFPGMLRYALEPTGLVTDVLEGGN